MRLLAPFLLCAFSLSLYACVFPGQSSYMNDPLTGGVDSRSSALLHIPLPPGLQYYPSHSRIDSGGRQGLEVLRGYVDQGACGANFYSSLRQAGWNLRLRQKAGKRAIYVYEKGGEMAALVFQAQGMLTIIQVWLGPRLADDAALSDLSDDGWVSLPGETYGPAEEEPKPGAVEKWGVKEKDL